MPNCVGLQIPRDRKKLSDGKFLAVGCNTVSRALSVLRLECVLAGKSCTGGKMMALLARDTPLCAWKSDCTAQRYEFETNQTNKNG